MADALTLRFEENTYYDIEQDVEVVRLLGITGKGTYWSEAEADWKGLGAWRRRFKDEVLKRMRKGEPPDYIIVDEEVAA